jgi:4-amino-4-deoxy-L-arabinose transferase-like glycosyltransferase
MAEERRETVSEAAPARAPAPAPAWGLAAAGLIVCFLTLALLGVRRQDATSDERHYFGVGRDIVRTHEWHAFGALLHPPLSYYVNSLPLLWLGESSPEDPLALFLCRATSLVVFGVPLLVIVACWARELYGPAAGLAALALIAFSPTFLAHAPLITPDVPLAATGLLALYLFHRHGHGAARPWAWGLALGLCLLTKVSAWLFVAAVVIDGSVLAWRRRDPAIGLRLATGLLLAYATLNAGYGFKGLFDVQGKAALIARVPDPPLVRLAAHAAAPFFPLPYLQAAATQLRVGWLGWPAYLMGQLSMTGWWDYFLVALLVKETIPFLLVVAAGLAAFPWKRAGRAELLLLLPPLLFFACFSLGRVQIGIRYVLPAFPFLAIFVSSLARLRGRRTLAILGVLLAAHAAVAVRACPDYIAYFNELVGGPKNGYRWLADSNLDWGQNETRLRAYAREHGIAVEPDVLPSTGLVAVRVNRLVGIGDPETYRVLREQYDPVGNVGYNWLIYDLGRKRTLPRDRPALR